MQGEKHGCGGNGGGDSAGRRRGIPWGWLALAGLIVLLDQISKWAALDALRIG